MIEKNGSPTPTRFILMNTVAVQNPDLKEKRTWFERGLLTLLRHTLPPHRDNETASEHLHRNVGRENRHIEWCSVRPDSLVDAELSPYDINESPTTGILTGCPTARSNVAHFMTDLIENSELWKKWEFRMPVVMNATDKIMPSLATYADELEREKARQRTYDAMERKAKAGHVTGGRVFGYDNVPVLLTGLDGTPYRSHVERRINQTEAEVVKRIFCTLCAGSWVYTDREATQRGTRGDAPFSAGPSKRLVPVLNSGSASSATVSRTSDLESNQEEEPVGDGSTNGSVSGLPADRRAEFRAGWRAEVRGDEADRSPDGIGLPAVCYRERRGPAIGCATA